MFAKRAAIQEALEMARDAEKLARDTGESQRVHEALCAQLTKDIKGEVAHAVKQIDEIKTLIQRAQWAFIAGILVVLYDILKGKGVF